MDEFFNQDQQNQRPIMHYSLENPRYAPLKAGLLGFLIMFLAFSIIGALLEGIIFGFKAHDYGSTQFRLFQISNEIWFFLFTGLAFSYYVYSDVTKVIRLHKIKLWELFSFAAGLAVLLPFLNFLTVVQNYGFTILQDRFAWFKTGLDYAISLDKLMQDSYSALLRPNNVLDQILIVIVVAITPAVCEEIFFRGFLQRSFELRYTKRMGAVLAAVLFAFMHMNPFGTVALFALGLYFGYAVYKTDSIFVAMLLHFLNNLFSTIMSFLQHGNDADETFTKVSPVEFKQALFYILVLGVLFILIQFRINLTYKKLEEESPV